MTSLHGQRCWLCKTFPVSRPTHVVPAWSFVGLASRAESDAGEHLVCAACEARLGASEAYVARVGLQHVSVDDFPALDVVDEIRELSGGGFVIADASALDCAAIVRFGVGVLWRASVSGAFPGVHLGERHEDALAGYLLHDSAPLPGCARMIVEIFATPSDLRDERLVLAPISIHAGSFHVHRFALFGMSFHLVTGSLLPASLDAVDLERTRRAILSDATTLVPSVTQIFPQLHATSALRPPRGRVGLQRSPRLD